MTKNISSLMSARCLRELILKLAYSAGNNAAHLGGALSCIDFISVVDNVFSLDNPLALSSLVLSKGHACLALYALMIKNGICSFEVFLLVPEKK